MIGSSPTYTLTRVTLTLINGWHVFPDATYGTVIEVIKDAQGTCSLNGLLQGGTLAQDFTVIPVGYRPAYSEYFIGVAYGGGVHKAAGIYLGPNGNAGVQTGGTDFVSLNQVRWKVGSL